MSDKYKFLSRLIITHKILRGIVFLFAIYLFAFPYIPALVYAFTPKPVVVPATLELYSLPAEFLDSAKNKEHVLYIPKINVNQKIIETDRIQNVHENVWRFPTTSTPDAAGNTVMLAHRYRTLGGQSESTFYNLPKLENGDNLYVAWQGQIYIYTVDDTMVVTPKDIWILDPTDEPMLTLYTCTPLWTAENRFVVRSKLITVVVPGDE